MQEQRRSGHPERVDGAWSTGNITDEMVQEYLEYHRDSSNVDTGNIILE